MRIKQNCTINYFTALVINPLKQKYERQVVLVTVVFQWPEMLERVNGPKLGGQFGSEEPLMGSPGGRKSKTRCLTPERTVTGEDQDQFM